MAVIAIQQLEVGHFRGWARPISLNLDGRSLVLYGENGTGKSSMVDALEKLFVGRVGSLDGRAQGLSSEKHAHHVGSAEPMNVSVSIGTPKTQGTPVALDSDRSNLPLPVSRYLGAASEPLYILRRSHLIRFIDSKPKDRYELLRPFLPLDATDELEARLQRVVERVEEISRTRNESVAHETRALATALGLPPDSLVVSEVDALTSLLRLLAAANQPSVRDIQALPAAIEQLSKSLEQVGNVALCSALMTSCEDLSSLTADLAESALPELTAVMSALRETEGKHAKLLFDDVLEHGAEWIRKEALSACPLCEQSIDVQQVLARIAERVSSMREVLDVRDQIRAQLVGCRERVRDTTQKCQRVQQHLRTLAGIDATAAQATAADTASILGDLTAALAADTASIDITRLSSAHERLLTRSAALAGVDNQLRQILSSLSTGKETERRMEVLGQLRRASTTWTRLLAARTAATAATRTALIVRKAQSYLLEARKAEVQILFDELSGAVGSIFHELRRQPELTGVKLDVKPGGQGSANLSAAFFGLIKQDPRAYYSEANLDMLGLSIFLAMREAQRKEIPHFNLLILDDVLGSIDRSHASKAAECILKRFKDYQVIITTHERGWYEHLKVLQSANGRRADYVNKEIRKWSIKDGPDLTESEHELAHLRDVISDGRKGDVASAAGRVLEELLHEMRFGLRLSVPANVGDAYTIGDLWPPFAAKVRKEYPVFHEAASGRIATIERLRAVRNWEGAHFNEWAKELSSDDALDFGKAVEALAALLHCESCAQYIRASRDVKGFLGCVHKVYFRQPETLPKAAG